jgi:uncharacterized Zn finger protein (UPF0148 family)
MLLQAFMNNGRWIMICPQCGTPLPAREHGVICPRCYPGMLAKALRPLSNGDLRPVTDQELVSAARAAAHRAGEEYYPEYPAEREQIERILRMRPDRKNMNWILTETLDDLRAQNVEHGDPVPEEE